jgi:hypothetical protein
MTKTMMLPLLAGAMVLAACGGTGEADKAANDAPAEQAAIPAAPDTAAPAEAAAPAGPAAGWSRITVTGYSCGDNCYVEYTTPTSTETLTAMCETPLCNSWFEVQAMPDSERGRQYDVRMGTANQVDGEGVVMEEGFQAIVEMRPVG